MPNFDINHPLFDEHGLYRLATRESVFADGGERSVREFFHARARVELQREWQERVPEKPQDWGYDEDTNRFIHETMLEGRRRSQPAVSAAEEERPVRGISLSAAVYSPALAGNRPLPAAILPWDIYSESAPEHVSRSDKDAFMRHSDRFAVSVGPPGRELPDCRQSLLLILTHELLVEIGNLFGDSKPFSDQEALAVIRRIVNPDSYKLDVSEPSRVPRAVRLAGKLATAPALEGVTSENGYRAEINFDRECPGLDFGTYLLLLLGPVKKHAL